MESVVKNRIWLSPPASRQNRKDANAKFINACTVTLPVKILYKFGCKTFNLSNAVRAYMSYVKICNDFCEEYYSIRFYIYLNRAWQRDSQNAVGMFHAFPCIISIWIAALNCRMQIKHAHKTKRLHVSKIWDMRETRTSCFDVRMYFPSTWNQGDDNLWKQMD